MFYPRISQMLLRKAGFQLYIITLCDPAVPETIAMLKATH